MTFLWLLAHPRPNTKGKTGAGVFSFTLYASSTKTQETLNLSRKWRQLHSFFLLLFDPNGVQRRFKCGVFWFDLGLANMMFLFKKEATEHGFVWFKRWLNVWAWCCCSRVSVPFGVVVFHEYSIVFFLFVYYDFEGNIIIYLVQFFLLFEHHVSVFFVDLFTWNHKILHMKSRLGKPY